MNLGFIGLGRMGGNLVLNLLEHGHTVVAYDQNPSLAESFANRGAIAAADLRDLVNKLERPRIVWMMVPAGEPVERLTEQLFGLLDPHDIVIDGGNSHYKDSVRRAESGLRRQILYMDAGTSGGMEGARHGACMMVGGDEGAFRRIEPLLCRMCTPGGYMHAGPSGSGHYLKMVHNGIEYGMMQAIAEGFELLHQSAYDYSYEQVARLWANGSVIRGWLMELTERAFAKDAALESIQGVMQSSGEGKWTVEAALELETCAPVIALSLLMRYRSLQSDTFHGKVVAALRREFGGHGIVAAQPTV